MGTTTHARIARRIASRYDLIDTCLRSGRSRTPRLVTAARLCSRLVPDVLQVLQILVVFVTRHLEELVLLPVDREGDGPGARIDKRIGHRRLVMDRIGVYR